jgi:pyrophosphatase PpaX
MQYLSYYSKKRKNYGRIILGDNMNKLTTILFDLDGTLINTNEVIIESFRATFTKHFPDISLDREKILSFIGPTLQDTFSEYTQDPFLIQEMIDSYREFYVDYEMGNFEIYPQVLETIKTLKLKGYQLGIVTSKFKVAAWPSFTYYALDEYFDVFVALDDVKNPKPDREPIDVALSRFPSNGKAIMIGDNQGDILAGKNAGIYSAGVAWSVKGSSHLMEVTPDFMLGQMSDIFHIIKQINKEES